MGISASKRVSESLNNSTEFNSACNSTYETSLSLAQHAFAGLRPYQLYTATERLQQTLYSEKSVPLISKWVPSPPSREQVDQAFKTILRRRQESDTDDVTLGNADFKEFSVEVFTDVVVSGARAEVLKKVPVGFAGIAGVGLLVRPGKEIVGTAIGVYTLGVVTAVYFSLMGSHTEQHGGASQLVRELSWLKEVHTAALNLRGAELTTRKGPTQLEWRLV